MDADSIVNSRKFLLTGSYTSDSGGSGVGIGALPISADRGVLNTHLISVSANVAPSPAFIAVHPTRPVLYAIAAAEGSVRAFRTDPDGLPTLAETSWPAGERACHVAVHPGGRYIVVTCWGDGQVILYELDSNGSIVNRKPAERTADPSSLAADNFGSQRRSRAHETLILPDGTILTTDIGLDLLRVWHYERGHGLVLDDELALPVGSGPRHMALHSSGNVYVVTEYSIEVLIVSRDIQTGRFALLSRTPATAGGARPEDAGAEISIDDSGKHAYVSVRSSNRIVTLAVSDDGTMLTPVADVDCGGDWPRFHLQRGSWLHVANQRSNNVATFLLDAHTGVPRELIGSVDVGSPSCLVPIG